MSLLPGWAPNAHPLLVHFPIALLLTATLLDVAGLVWRGGTLPRQAATLFYVLGTVAAVAAFVTGRAAAQTIFLPGMAQPVVGAHWTWALRTVWFYGALTLARLVLLRVSTRTPGLGVRVAFVLAGLVGASLLIETGDRGGSLVYQHGVGTVGRP